MVYIANKGINTIKHANNYNIVILKGYLPVAPDRRESILERKRKEYFGFLDQYFGTRHEDQYQHIFRQIHIDVPRMNPLIPLFQTKLVQEVNCYSLISVFNFLFLFSDGSLH